MNVFQVDCWAVFNLKHPHWSWEIFIVKTYYGYTVILQWVKYIFIEQEYFTILLAMHFNVLQEITANFDECIVFSPHLFKSMFCRCVVVCSHQDSSCIYLFRNSLVTEWMSCIFLFKNKTIVKWSKRIENRETAKWIEETSVLSLKLFIHLPPPHQFCLKHSHASLTNTYT